MHNPYKPAEQLLLSTPIGLDTLGSVFKVEAPFAACRLCGAIYQSSLDRRAYSMHLVGDEDWLVIYQDATVKRTRWRELHTRRYHTQDEIDLLQRLGWALMPQAAHKLAPYGITPLGNMHEEIIDALVTAPRAPLDDPEGR